MSVLRKNTTLMSLTDMHEAMLADALPLRAVAITFDDGYADNALNASPILEILGVPATVFVATDHIDGCREMWWDELERLVLHSHRLPKEFTLDIDGSEHTWQFANGVRQSMVQRWKDRHWRAWHEQSQNPRHQLYRQLWFGLHPMLPDQRDAALKKLAEAIGASPNVRVSHRGMHLDELRKMSARSLVEIGGHTQHHPSLAALTADQQAIEIRQGKKLLEEMIDHEVTSFAYPYGSADDQNDTTVQIVQQAGFHRACTTIEQPVTKHCSPMLLPRHNIQNWTGEEFAMRIEQWFDADIPAPSTVAGGE